MRFLVSVDVNFFGAASFGAARRLCLVGECSAALPYFRILEIVVFSAVDFLLLVHGTWLGCIWIFLDVAP